MRKLWKVAGANEPDVTCLALWGGFVLSLGALGVIVVDRMHPATAGGVDLALALLLVFSSALGSFLALRGNTYDDSRSGSWWSKITREGRAAIVILAVSAVVAVGKDVLGAEHAHADAIEQQIRLAENSKLQIDAIGTRLANVQSDMRIFIEANKNNINDAEERRFRSILGEVTGVRATADSSGRTIVQGVELLAANTDGLLTRLVSSTQDLSTQGNATLGALQEGRLQIERVAASVTAVDTLLKTYQTTSAAAIATATNASLGARTSLDSLSNVVRTLQGALVLEQDLRGEITRLSSANGTLQGRVTELESRVASAEEKLASSRTQPTVAQAQPPRDSTATQ